MGPGVIADQVTGIDNASSEFAFGLRKFANHEETGMHIVFGKDLEKARRPCRIRAIVEGEGKLSRAARRNEGTAEDLRARPARGIRESADAESQLRQRQPIAL